MKLVPLHDKIIIAREEEAKITKGGIHLADNVRTKMSRSYRGKVIAVGPGKMLDNGTLVPMPVKPGDTVIYDPFRTEEIEHDDQKLSVMSVDEIVAKVDG